MPSACLTFFSLLALVGASDTVNTSFGKLVGSRDIFNGCDRFLGVPYAKPPIDSLRFEDPVAWQEPYPAEGRRATSFSASCPQFPVAGDEDCLYLNVWRPARGSSDNLAVLVFIYGGGFITGGSSASILGPVPEILNLYDGCGLVAKHDVVVATINYRLGVLGFAAFEDNGTPSGNFGMKDQRQALLWLQKELPAFGGNPAKVTLFGESAGGMSVFYHVASPRSKGLFRGAISESGFPTAWSWKKGREMTSSFAAKMGCRDSRTLKACLRGLPAKALAANQTATANPLDFPTAHPPWQPSVDGLDMPRYPWSLFKERQTNAVPMMAGTNTNEANLFVWPFYEKGMNQSQFEDYFLNGIAKNYGQILPLQQSERANIIASYTDAQLSGDDKRMLASQIATDVSFQCGTHIAGQAYSSDFWLYRFNHRSACQFWLDGLMPGVYHTSELQYVWGAQAKLACVLTPSERALSDRMQTMWVNFANCLDPTCGKDTFPRYLNSSRKALVFQTPADTIEVDYNRDRCEMWDQLIFEKYRGQSGGPATVGEMVI